MEHEIKYEITDHEDDMESRIPMPLAVAGVAAMSIIWWIGLYTIATWLFEAAS